jgi:hypothetical protein
MVTDNDTCKIKVLETVHASFARTLERELTALTAERDQLRSEFEKLAITTAQAQDRNVSHRLERDKAEAERTDAIYQRACEVERDLRAQLHALQLVCGTNDANKFETWVDRANARAEKAEAELKRYTDAVDAQPWATDEPIRVLLDRITADLNGESEAITDRSERYRLATLRLDAELATERARFEHLEKIARLESGNCDRSTTSYYVIHIRTGRDYYKGGSDLPLAEAIDAAMKKGK